jgi:hypothetical protein
VLYWRATQEASFPFQPRPSFLHDLTAAGSYEASLNACYDQFKANREINANCGLKWNQSGISYYSECLKHLKP